MTQLLRPNGLEQKATVERTASLRRLYPSVRVHEPIYNASCRDELEQTSSLAVASSRMRFTFDDEILESAVYRRASIAVMRHCCALFRLGELLLGIIFWSSHPHRSPMSSLFKRRPFRLTHWSLDALTRGVSSLSRSLRQNARTPGLLSSSRSSRPKNRPLLTAAVGRTRKTASRDSILWDHQNYLLDHCLHSGLLFDELLPLLQGSLTARSRGAALSRQSVVVDGDDELDIDERDDNSSGGPTVYYECVESMVGRRVMESSSTLPPIGA